jgi:RNase H-like domain found in reverse transcriptase/Integrase zinc binding domain/Chromo (CHRromatin Organisation MOdifier) domain
MDSTDERISIMVQFETEEAWTTPFRALLDNGSQETILSRRIFDKVRREGGKATAEAGHVPMVDAEGRPMSRMERFSMTIRAPKVVNGNDETRTVSALVNVKIDDSKQGDEIIISSTLSRQLGWAILHEAEIAAIRRGADDDTRDKEKQAYIRDVEEQSKEGREKLKGQVRETLEHNPTAAAQCCAKIDEAKDILLVNMLPDAHFKQVAAFGSESVQVENMVRPKPHHEPPKGSLKDMAIKKLIALFVMLGILVACGASPYAYPVFLVGSEPSFRMVANAVIAATNVVRVSTTTLNADAEMQKQRGHKVFFKADVIKAFYMTKVKDTVSPHIRTMVYGGQYYLFTRLIMGEVNSAEFLIRTMEQMFGQLPWLSKFMDDILGGAETDEEFAIRFCLFLDICMMHGVLLHIGKMQIARRLHWVGHFVSGEGISPDPYSKDILWSIPAPADGEQLARIIGSFGYFEKFIPQLAIKMEPMRAVMERIYKAAGTRKNSSVRKHKVAAFGWTIGHKTLFDELKGWLANSVTLAVRNPDLVMVLHTDACNTGWAGMIMQCPKEDLGLTPKERRNQLLWCCGGLFNKTQQRWPTVEQEAYAVVRSLGRMVHVLGYGDKVHIFTDNKVLSHVFDLKSDYVRQEEQLGQGRLIRWIADMALIDYTITHLPGETNEFADLISRLRVFPVDGSPVEPDEDDIENPDVPSLLTRMVSAAHIEAKEEEREVDGDDVANNGTRSVGAVRIEHNLRTVLDDDWVIPVVSHVRELIGRDGEQDGPTLALARKHHAVLDFKERVWKVKGKVLIPEGPLRLALMAQAHSYGGGHRGVETTTRLLAAVVFWPSMAAEIKEFVDSCIHCIEKQSWMVPRPYGEQIMPHKRNEVVGYDYLDMGVSEFGEFTKLLVITDKLTKYTHLRPAKSESSEATALGLVDWLAKLGAPPTWLSDEGTAMKNATVTALVNKLKSKHHFTTAHSSWANGKQERLNYTIANIFRTLLSESGLPSSHWIHLVEIVEMIINHTAVESLGWMAPIQAFLGLQPITPLDSFLDPTTREWKQVKINIQDLKKYVKDFHEEVEAREVILDQLQEQAAARTRQIQEDKRGVKTLELEIGDFVMVQESTKHKFYPKLAKRWIGPARVVGFNKEQPHTVDVEYLNAPTKRRIKEKVHAKRVKFFDIKGLTITPELMAHAAYTAARKWNVERIADIRGTTPKNCELRVMWQGYGDTDATWERLSTLFEDVPKLVEEFLKSSLPEGTKELKDKVLKLPLFKGLRQKEGSVA